MITKPNYAYDKDCNCFAVKGKEYTICPLCGQILETCYHRNRKTRWHDKHFRWTKKI